MNNYFQKSKQYPYHLSVGALVVNNKGEIACHYFDKLNIDAGNFKDLFILMRETINPNETIEDCLKRGLMEEFGMEATLKAYLGSIVANFISKDVNIQVEKTTLYFLCDFISIDESRRASEDVEATSKIVWVEPVKLFNIMRNQGKRLGRSDADESSIIEKILKK